MSDLLPTIYSDDEVEIKSSKSTVKHNSKSLHKNQSVHANPHNPNNNVNENEDDADVIDDDFEFGGILVCLNT